MEAFMRNWSNGVVLALVMTAAIAGVAQADTIFGGPMTGTQESPPTPATGTGTVTCTLSSANVLHIHIVFSGLTGAVTQAHVHAGGYGVSGGVRFNIPPSTSPIDADWSMTAAQTDSLRNGFYYANLHTTTFGAGEIRAQLDWQFEANMDGNQETTVVNEWARGECLMRYNALGSRMAIVATNLGGLSGPVNAAHIHLAPPDSSGAVQFIFPTFPNPTTTVNWTGMTAAQKTALLAGRLYVNFHTAANPNGECRGQIFQPAQTSVSPAGRVGTSTGLRSYPNPMSASSTVQFSVAHDQPANLRIVDITGREVRQFSSMARSGDNAFTWDGRDSRGSTVPAGVYYYVLRTSAGQETAKTIVLR
jgi:hypothetical protein